MTGYARHEAGVEAGATGPATVSCREHRATHEIDVLALKRGARPRTTSAAVAFLAEAKSQDRRPGIAELRRLEHIRELLSGAGHDATSAVLGIFSTHGFTEELAAEARRRHGRLLLIGLEQLYGDRPIQ